MNRLEISNRKFGKLTALNFINKRDKWGAIYWNCLCDCGNEIEVPGKSLMSGKTQSCGCINRARGKHSIVWRRYGEIGKKYFSQIKYGAISRSISFNISIEYISDLFESQNRKCALSGINLIFDSISNACDGNASLDRIDSSKGYEIGNLQWIHKTINEMKNNQTQEEFVNFCKLIAAHNV